MNLQDECQQTMEAVYKKATSLYGVELKLPTIEFKFIGRCAGYANPGKNLIVINTHFLEKERNFIEDTIPHECMHLIAPRVYRGAKGHNPLWKRAMRDLGYPPTRCHNYDLEDGVFRVQEKFIYECPRHGVFIVSKTLHNKMQKGARYVCKKCKSPLIFKSKKEKQEQEQKIEVPEEIIVVNYQYDPDDFL